MTRQTEGASAFPVLEEAKMALLISSTDLAIALAIKAGTLRTEVRPSRFGDTFVAISDEVGLIEVHLSQAEADARLAKIQAALS
jgi:hypothetical protein